MTRTKNITLSLITTLAMAAAVAAAGQAYTSPNAALNSGTSAERPAGGDFQGSVNAVLSERADISGSRTDVSTPNAILGAGNVGEVAATPVDDSSGFDWGSAGIGAGAVVGVMLLGLGAIALSRRRHEPTVQPS